MRARMAALAMHARHDTRETTAAARSAKWARYLDLVDPDRELSGAERQRRAEAARRADMARLAYRSSRARSNGTGGGQP